MRQKFGARTFGLFLSLVSAALCLQAPSANASKSSLGTVTAPSTTTAAILLPAP